MSEFMLHPPTARVHTIPAGDAARGRRDHRAAVLRDPHGQPRRHPARRRGGDRGRRSDRADDGAGRETQDAEEADRHRHGGGAPAISRSASAPTSTIDPKARRRGRDRQVAHRWLWLRRLYRGDRRARAAWCRASTSSASSAASSSSRCSAAKPRSTGRSSATARSWTCAARISGPYCYPIAIDLLARGLVTSKGIVTHGYALGAVGRGDQGRQFARFDQGADEAVGRLKRAMRGMEHVIGVDIGTQSTKALLVDGDGRIVAQHASGYQPETPKPLWAEQWPAVWLAAVIECVDAVRGQGCGAGVARPPTSRRSASAACMAAPAFPSMPRCGRCIRA